MIAALIVITLALAWLALETDRLRVRLPFGALAVSPYMPTRVVAGKRCPKCQSPYASQYNVLASHVSTYTETIGNSTVTFTRCVECAAKLRAEIGRAQFAKPRLPKCPQTPLCNGTPMNWSHDIEISRDGAVLGTVTTGEKRGTVKSLMLL